MPKFPEPPPRGALAARLPPELRVLRRRALLWRIYSRGGPHPVAWNAFRHWGRAVNARFDHHTDPAREQPRGILYAGLRAYTCVAEVFQDTRTIERSRNAPWLVGFELARDASLLDLTGTWPTRAGASMALNTGRRDRARAWSRRIYEDYPAVDGIHFSSSMDSNQQAVALYERAAEALPVRPAFHRALNDPALNAVVAKASALFGYFVQP